MHNIWRLYERAVQRSKPPKATNPDEWARINRVHGRSSGHPGPRNPWLTPYIVPIERTIAMRRFRKVVLIISAQSGKTEMLLDVIGHRFSERPAPTLYVGPNRTFLTDQFNPRLMEMLNTAPTLRDKVARGKRIKQAMKIIDGNTLRLAHGGSSTALKADPIALAITDELEDFLADVKGKGDPVTLIDLRGENYADFVHVITSTPGEGMVEPEFDELSGLEFWSFQGDPDVMHSAVWRLWQQGTRHHWSWRCPGCEQYFIPRFSCLEWPSSKLLQDEHGEVKTRKLTVEEVRAATFLRCPHKDCGHKIYDNDQGLTKRALNHGGVFVAPGQRIDSDGEIHGEHAASQTASFWVSGLASPFKTFGDRAAEYVSATRGGQQAVIKGTVNGSLGELFSPAGGDAPRWSEVWDLRSVYKMRERPEEARLLTAGVDVQKNRLVVIVRGWGHRMESWLIAAEEFAGPTHEDEVWAELSDFLATELTGLRIKETFIDSGFRPGKRESVPEHKVYAFCRRTPRTHAAKGFENRSKPVDMKQFEVNSEGKAAKYGLELARVDSDFCKSWVHERVRWPKDKPGAWHIPNDVTEDYCQQIVSEARIRKAAGGFTWRKITPENHFLDAEALAFAAAWYAGAPRISEFKREARTPSADKGQRPKLSDIGRSQSHNPW